MRCSDPYRTWSKFEQYLRSYSRPLHESSGLRFAWLLNYEWSFKAFCSRSSSLLTLLPRSSLPCILSSPSCSSPWLRALGMLSAMHWLHRFFVIRLLRLMLDCRTLYHCQSWFSIFVFVLSLHSPLHPPPYYLLTPIAPLLFRYQRISPWSTLPIHLPTTFPNLTEVPLLPNWHLDTSINTPSHIALQLADAPRPAVRSLRRCRLTNTIVT